MKKEETRGVACILCPMGCRAVITLERGEKPRVENIECPRGKDFALMELKAPKRDFFTIVGVRRGRISVCPVRTTQPIPKERVTECNLALAKTVVDAPIKAGQVIVKNLLGLEVDVIATRDISESTPREP